MLAAVSTDGRSPDGKTLHYQQLFMSENLQNPPVATAAATPVAVPAAAAAPVQAVSNQNMAMIVYILYLVGFLIGLSALVGVILAHVNASNEQNPVIKSHFSYQIRTFWWGLLWVFIGLLTSIILVGYLVLLGWFIWTLVRCIKGLSALNRQEAIN